MGKNKIAPYWCFEAPNNSAEKWFRGFHPRSEAFVTPPSMPMCIFFLTFGSKNLIYESHCDLEIANLMLGRITR